MTMQHGLMLAGTTLEGLRAVLDRIIPADDFPCATVAGVDLFIVDLWDAGLIDQKEEILRGLAGLDRAAGGLFELLSETEQDRLLQGVSHTDWFSKLCELAAEGYYSDPDNGANPDAISWKMIGYRPGLPEGPSGPPVDPGDAIRGRLRA
jgi:hypothetical protein